MRAITLIFIAIVAANTAAATELYRWVDEQGRLHYSDRPVEGAETVTLGTTPAPARAPAPAAASRPAPPRPDPAAAEQTAPVAYKSVGILSPAEDEVLWNIGSVLTVKVDVQPGLQPGHRIVVRYNGQTVADWPAEATTHQITEVYRGTHTVAVSVIDAGGNPLAASEPVTFHVKQTSILKPPVLN